MKIVTNLLVVCSLAVAPSPWRRRSINGRIRRPATRSFPTSLHHREPTWSNGADPSRVPAGSNPMQHAWRLKIPGRSVYDGGMPRAVRERAGSAQWAWHSVCGKDHFERRTGTDGAAHTDGRRNGRSGRGRRKATVQGLRSCRMEQPARSRWLPEICPLRQQAFGRIRPLRFALETRRPGTSIPSRSGCRRYWTGSRRCSPTFSAFRN